MMDFLNLTEEFSHFAFIKSEKKTIPFLIHSSTMLGISALIAPFLASKIGLI